MATKPDIAAAISKGAELFWIPFALLRSPKRGIYALEAQKARLSGVVDHGRSRGHQKGPQTEVQS